MTGFSVASVVVVTSGVVIGVVSVTGDVVIGMVSDTGGVVSGAEVTGGVVTLGSSTGGSSTLLPQAAIIVTVMTTASIKAISLLNLFMFVYLRLILIVF